ncbi:transposase [Streptomyces violaceusniger]|uniref:transposase n=1 Tax=Streptomyces violaceusniger TaxID=68280 RepID=UPI00380C3A03
MLAEVGDITRFASSAKLARYTGCAPIPVYSSDKERHRLHTAAAIDDSTACSTPWRSSSRGSILARGNYWIATHPRRAPEAPGAYSSAASSTSSTAQWSATELPGDTTSRSTSSSFDIEASTGCFGSTSPRGRTFARSARPL